MIARLPLPLFAMIAGSLLTFATSAAEPEITLLLGSIDGAEQVLLLEPGGAERRIKPGERVAPGDTVVTGSAETVTLRTGDGTVIVVGRSTRFLLELSDVAERAATLGTGSLRGIFGKRPAPAVLTAKPKHRFIIRTRSAVFGVRGTDLVLNATDEVAQLHTLEGVVEAAAVETELVEGNPRLVPSGLAVRADADGVAEPVVFDRAQFSAEMSKEQPGLAVSKVEQTAAPAPDAASDTSGEARFKLWLFQVGAGNVSYDKSKEVLQGGLALHWAPTAKIRPWLFLRGGLGAYQLSKKEQFSIPSVFAVETFAMLSFRIFGRVLVELGPRVHYWIGKGAGGGLLFGLGWQFGSPLFGVIERIAAHGGQISIPAVNGHTKADTFRFSVGLQLF